MADYNLTKMAVNMFCPGNEVKLDDAGLPSIMVYIPAFKNSDVLTGGDDNIHPAFIVNGKQIPGFYYSKYENVVHNGMAYSLPAEDPAANITFDESCAHSENKGYGWHMSTAAEWAAIALWCKKNGALPYGNNNNGRDSRESTQKAIVTYQNEAGTASRVASGTGPLTWSHDGTASGIWDMNGNVGERQAGFRLVWGEIQILADNDAANPENPQNKTSVCWKAINASDGSLVDPESKTTDTAAKMSGSTVKLDFVSGAWTYSTGITSAEGSTRSCLFASMTCNGTIGNAAKVLLRALALLPDEGAAAEGYENDYAWINNGAAECLSFRGGSWINASNSGIFAINCSNDRTGRYEHVGFRSAYIPNL